MRGWVERQVTCGPVAQGDRRRVASRTRGVNFAPPLDGARASAALVVGRGMGCCGVRMVVVMMAIDGHSCGKYHFIGSIIHAIIHYNHSATNRLQQRMEF